MSREILRPAALFSVVLIGAVSAGCYSADEVSMRARRSLCLERGGRWVSETPVSVSGTIENPQTFFCAKVTGVIDVSGVRPAGAE